MRYPCFIMRSKKYKCIVILLGILVLVGYLLIFYSILDNNHSNINNTSYLNLKHVVVHLDLKGAPPKLQYLERLLPLFKKLGVTGNLMEYEDMFPYEGNLVNLSSTNHYDKSKLKKFLTKLSKAQIEVIPLIQTFGHMEHVLKLKEFRHLRENEIYPDSICPSNVESVELLKEMLEQVIYFHRNITTLQHIHIGCDEIYHINQCEKCRKRRITKAEIYIDHVRKLREIIFNISPYTTVLIWDDMLRGINKYYWKKSEVKYLYNVEPVYWDYSPIPELSHANLFQYHKTFRNIWIATAFKGADGRRAILPDFKARFGNHYTWMSLILDYTFAGQKKKHNFKGIILTGWSRYSHMDALCELLPPSIPSLILNLLLIQKFKVEVSVSDIILDADEFFMKYISPNLYRELHCQDFFLEIENLDMISDFCTYEGAILFSLLKDYKILKTIINTELNEEELGVPSIEYYGTTKYLNMNNAYKIREMCRTNLKNLLDWENRTSREMSEFYDPYVIQEYVGYKVYILKKRVKSTLKILENFMKTRTWERRT